MAGILENSETNTNDHCSGWTERGGGGKKNPRRLKNVEKRHLAPSNLAF